VVRFSIVASFFNFLGFLESINRGGHFKATASVNGINGGGCLKMPASVNRLTGMVLATASVKATINRDLDPRRFGCPENHFLPVLVKIIVVV
jgi:hypothetical protein